MIIRLQKLAMPVTGRKNCGPSFFDYNILTTTRGDNTFYTHIKDARNALDHGNKEHTLSHNTYLDSELLRAITYMLILKEANVPDAQIKKYLKKLSRFPL